jgi:hypothetical protein
LQRPPPETSPETSPETPPETSPETSPETPPENGLDSFWVVPFGWCLFGGAVLVVPFAGAFLVVP